MAAAAPERIADPESAASAAAEVTPPERTGSAPERAVGTLSAERAPTLPGLPPIAAAAGETDEERARRASVPSWDDILLGVRRRH